MTRASATPMNSVINRHLLLLNFIRSRSMENDKRYSRCDHHQMSRMLNTE